MRLCAGWILLLACGTPPAAVRPPTAAAVVTPPDAAPVVVVPRVISDGPVRAAIEAPGGGSIELLAITPDGKAAITADELGGVRLWPALDGSVEPRVVDLAEPKQLVIGTRPGGFTVVALDEVGGLVIANLDTDGRTHSHVTLDADPAYTGVVMTELGALAWRTDQTISLLGDDGVTRQRIGTEPGQRLLAVTAAGRHAAAVVETLDGEQLKRRVRRLVLEPLLAWGAPIDVGDEIGTDVAVSASGKRFAMIAQPKDKPQEVLAFEIATGKLVINEAINTTSEIGFVDDDHLALSAPNGVSWVNLDGTAPPANGITNNFAQPVPRLAVAGGHVIAAANGELLVATPTDTAFLGYGLESASVAAAAPGGALVAGLGETFVSLDATLHAVGTFELGLGSETNVAELHWLDGTDWLVEDSKVNDGTVAVSLVGTDGHKPQVLRTGVGVVQLLMADPTTHLVTLSLGETPEVDRYDPKLRSIAHVATLPKSKGYEQTELVPVSPSLAAGTQLIRVSMRDKMVVQWVRDPKVPATVASSVTIEGSLAGADAAGHVYAWRNSPAGQLELAIYRDGKPVGVLPHDGPVALWPDPQGTRLVEIGGRNIALYGVDGTRAWVQPISGATQALWLSDGAIAIVSAAGILRLDAATGSITAARCGWKFGLSPKPHPATPRIAPICAELDR